MRRTLAVIPALFAICAPTAHAQDAAEKPLADKIAAIDKLVDAKRQELHIPGVALVIVKDDKIVDIKGFGLRDVENKLPVTPDTLFAIGSSTKAFTAATVMMSVEEGKLKLDDRPSKYLPVFRLRDPDANAHITISDLLCHRSGLARTDLAWYTGKLSKDDVLRVVAEARPTAKLGGAWQYQNVMFMAAGEIVARVQHMPWESVVAQRIFRPLGMTSTNTSVPETLAARDHALGYAWDEDAKRAIHLPMKSLPCIAPAGAINSNVRDMAQWLRLMLGGGMYEGKRLLSQDSVAAVEAPHMKMAPGMDYGYGWMLHTWEGHKVVEHGGNIDGFNAQVAMMPDQHLGFVTLTNVSASSLGGDTMGYVWTNLVGKKSPDTAVAAAPSGPAADPAPEQGTYTLDKVTLDIAITLSDGKLSMHPTGQPVMPLTNVGGRRYRAGSPAPSDVYLTFRPSKDDPKRTELVLEQAGITFIGTQHAKEPFKAPITVEDLRHRMIDALGGEAALRRHRSSVTRSEVVLETQGMTADVTDYAEAPALSCEMTTYRALGRPIATERDCYDGSRSEAETSLGRTDVRHGTALANAAIDAHIHPELDWNSLFKSVSIVRMDKVAGEEVYVLECVPAKGTPVLAYVSTTSYLELKRERTGEPAETFGDYRTVDGEKVPFSILVEHSPEGRLITTVTDVKFNVRLAASTFAPRTGSELARAPEQQMASSAIWR